MGLLSRIKSFFFRYRDEDTGRFITKAQHDADPLEAIKHKVRRSNQPARTDKES